MDHNTNPISIEQFKLKYSNELNNPKGPRRKFSANFKSDLLITLTESKLTQIQFSKVIGISMALMYPEF